jgi:hypothetical protein
MYNLYDMYLRGNSVGCCPLYVGYYLLYVLTGELNRYRPDRQTDRQTRQTHFKSFQSIDVDLFSVFWREQGTNIQNCSRIVVDRDR